MALTSPMTSPTKHKIKGEGFELSCEFTSAQSIVWAARSLLGAASHLCKVSHYPHEIVIVSDLVRELDMAIKEIDTINGKYSNLNCHTYINQRDYDEPKTK